MPGANGERFRPINPTVPAEPPCPPGTGNPKKACNSEIAQSQYNPPDIDDYWPSRLRSLITACQEPGDSLRSGNRIKSDVICTLIGDITWPEGDNFTKNLTATTTKKVLDAITDDFDLHGGLHWWNDTVASVFGRVTEEALNVLAVRAFLIYVSEFTCNWHRQDSQDDTRGLSIGIQAFHIGPAAGSGRADVRESGLHAQVRPLIVYGIELLDQCLKMLSVDHFPSIAESISMYLAGTINDEQYRAYIVANGGAWSDFKQLAFSMRRKPEIDDIYRLRNRELVSNEGMLDGLRQLGFTHPPEAEGIGKLRYDVPGPSDLVRFAVRHVFEPDLLAKFGFNDERELGAFRLDAYHHTAGLDYPIFTGPLRAVVESVTGVNADTLAADYTARGLPEPTWAHAYWWAHWIIPPWTWGAEARFRLNPERDTSLEPDWMAGIQFTPKDYNDLLRMNDYPPFFREKMFALSYRPPQMRFMRLLVDQGQMNEAQLIDQMNRLGMMPKIAEKFSQAIIRDVREKRDPARLITKGGTNRTFRSIMKGYKLGTLTRDVAYQRLDDIGVARWAIDVYLDTTDADLKADYVATAIKHIRQDYMQGATDLLTTRQILARAGVVQDRANEYVDLWVFERNLTFKMATTGELLRWYTEGIIDQPTLLLRLRNLGWIQPDLLAYLAEGELRVQKRQAAIAAASLRSARANAALIEKLKRDADRQSRELESELRRLTPVGRLIKWARQGSVSEIYFENRLAAMGYPPDVIGEYWQEVIKDGPIKPRSGNGTVSGQAPSAP